jgi:hypothetical protein
MEVVLSTWAGRAISAAAVTGQRGRAGVELLVYSEVDAGTDDRVDRVEHVGGQHGDLALGGTSQTAEIHRAEHERADCTPVRPKVRYCITAPPREGSASALRGLVSLARLVWHPGINGALFR